MTYNGSNTTGFPSPATIYLEAVIDLGAILDLRKPSRYPVRVMGGALPAKGIAELNEPLDFTGASDQRDEERRARQPRMPLNERGIDGLRQGRSIDQASPGAQPQPGALSRDPQGARLSAAVLAQLLENALLNHLDVGDGDHRQGSIFDRRHGSAPENTKRTGPRSCTADRSEATLMSSTPPSSSTGTH